MTCSKCKSEIIVPHCLSRTCNWCKSCHDLKVAECAKAPKR